MGALQRAKDFVTSSGFLGAMAFRLEAHNEVLAIIRPFFPNGWSEISPILQKGGNSMIRRAAVALRRLDQLDDAFAVSEAFLRWTLSVPSREIDYRQFLELASTAGDQYRFALEERLLEFATQCASTSKDPRAIFSLRLAKFRQLSRLGKWNEADAQRPDSNMISDNRERALAAHHWAISLHLRGELTEKELRHAEQLSEQAGSALGRRNLCSLRGWWLSDLEEWKPARDSLSEAVALAHKAGKIDRRSEIRLALARYHLGENVQVQEICDQLSSTTDVLIHLPLALLWLAAGNTREAESHWYECGRARAVLGQIGAVVPALPRFDVGQSDILAWEPQAARAIEALKPSRQSGG